MWPRNLASSKMAMKGSWLHGESVEFKQPVHAADFLEVRGRITEVGRRSRKVEIEAYKVIEGDWEHGSSKAAVLPEPVLVARARGTVVAPKTN